MNVVVVTAEYPPYVQGGLGVHYYELVNSLRKYSNVNVICAQIGNAAPAEEHHKNLHIYRISIPEIFPLKHIIFYYQSFLLSRKIKKDVIHICSPFGILNALFEKERKIVKIHTMYSEQKGNFVYRNLIFPIGSLIDRFLVGRADTVITTSDFMRDQLKRNLSIDDEKLAVIPNGINPEFLNARGDKRELRKELNIPLDKKVVIYVGRFVERKGALNLVKAIPSVLLKQKNAHFILVGGSFAEGTIYSGKIQECVLASRIEQNVQLVDWVDRDTLIKFYLAADLLVHPATYEPFGNNILEAMACRLPVIVSRSGGPEEVIGTSGIILENNSPALLSGAITKVLKDKGLMEKLSGMSRKRARRFSWDNNALETSRYYEKTTIIKHNIAKKPEAIQ
jgi:glycogen synthase